VVLMRAKSKVLTTIVLRHKETLIKILDKITATVGQHARFFDRLRALEERVTQLEQR
jgi:hypothetical protein